MNKNIPGTPVSNQPTGSEFVNKLLRSTFINAGSSAIAAGIGNQSFNARQSVISTIGNLVVNEFVGQIRNKEEFNTIPETIQNKSKQAQQDFLRWRNRFNKAGVYSESQNPQLCDKAFSVVYDNIETATPRPEDMQLGRSIKNGRFIRKSTEDGVRSYATAQAKLEERLLILLTGGRCTRAWSTNRTYNILKEKYYGNKVTGRFNISGFKDIKGHHTNQVVNTNFPESVRFSGDSRNIVLLSEGPHDNRHNASPLGTTGRLRDRRATLWNFYNANYSRSQVLPKGRDWYK